MEKGRLFLAFLKGDGVKDSRGTIQVSSMGQATPETKP